jgi:hypothetical protein
MEIPRTKIEKFVAELVEMCTVSQRDRIQRGLVYRNYALYGAEQQQGAATFNKMWTYLGDLRSLMYSPVSLRFNILDPDVPSVVNEAKGRAAATKMRGLYRQSDTDTSLSAGTFWALVKGKTFIKQAWKRGNLSPSMIQPDAMGVMNEAHCKLDEDMEAFTHSFLVSPYQLARVVWDNPKRDKIIKKAKSHMQEVRADMTTADHGAMQIIIGGLYPYQPTGQGPSAGKGIVDWMGAPSAQIDPRVADQMIRIDELWVWDDDRQGWATFQSFGKDTLIFGDTFIANKMAWDSIAKKENDDLKALHPFGEISPNPIDGYFWGRSEVVNTMLLQYALNKRIDGINKMLRKQEDPPKKITGSSGVNQQAIQRFNKPGGWWVDSNPNAKLEEIVPTITSDLWNDLHEVERMFDEMGGLPPVARGRGEAGVRGASHAETLIRMATPRLKDSALLVERDVEGIAGLSLDLCKAYVDKKLIAWVAQQEAGVEGSEPDPLLKPPVPGQIPVYFTFGDLQEEMTVTVDSHASSPAFQQDARALLFDLFKIGAIAPADMIERVDISDPEGLVAGVERREAAKAAQIQAMEQKDPEAAMKLIQGGKKK